MPESKRTTPRRDELVVVPESSDRRIVKERLKEAEAEKAQKGEVLTPVERMHIARSRFTPERCAAIVENIRRGAPITSAALATGIHRTTFQSWLAKAEEGIDGYVEFAADVEQAEAQAEIDRVQRIAEQGEKGFWTADAWYLERRYPERWGKRENINHSSSEPIKVKLSW